jgi:cytosine/adenosine deaminase-related metal-dependent hydrolase
MVLAHCIWPTEDEIALIAKCGASVAHCPSSNLKLASGFAPVPEMIAKGINVAIGSDGAPCNNNLDAFTEMRLASLIHKPRIGPRSMDAKTVLKMMTLGGAQAIGLEDQIGSLEPGKRADIILIKRHTLHTCPLEKTDPYVEIVYEHRAQDVDTVIIDGEIVFLGGEFVHFDVAEVLREARKHRSKVLRRVGNPWVA